MGLPPPSFEFFLTNSVESSSVNVSIPNTPGRHTVDVVIDNRSGQFDGDINAYIQAGADYNGRIFGMTCAKNTVDCTGTIPILDIVFPSDYIAWYECTWDGTKFVGLNNVGGVAIAVDGSVCYSQAVDVTISCNFVEPVDLLDPPHTVNFYVASDSHIIVENLVTWSGTTYTETVRIPAGSLIGDLMVWVWPTVAGVAEITNVTISPVTP